jgi:hypothetical protein
MRQVLGDLLGFLAILRDDGHLDRVAAVPELLEALDVGLVRPGRLGRRRRR